MRAVPASEAMKVFHTKVEITRNSIQVRAQRGYLLTYSLVIFMSVTTLQFLLGHTREEKLFSLIIPFCTGWLIATILDDFLCYRSSITVDASGITAFSPLRGTISLRWNTIQDYGFSAVRHTASFERLYCLYFADSVLSWRKGGLKRFKGRYIRILIDERVYLLSGYNILEYCEQYTNVKPFTADPRNH